MGRRKKLDGAEQSLIDEFHRLVRGGRTIEEIREHLAALGLPMSNGATGRAVKSARESMARWKEAQEIAGQWTAQLGENPRGDVGVMLSEMLMLLVYNTMGTMSKGDAEGVIKAVKPMDLMMLAKSLQSLETTQKQSMERREKIERAVLERQSKAAEQTARDLGVGDAGWEAIRKKFLGVDQAQDT